MKNRISFLCAAALVLASAVGAASLGCSTYAPPVVKFAAPPPSAASWDEVFAHPSEATVETLTTGEVASTARAPAVRLEVSTAA